MVNVDVVCIQTLRRWDGTRMRDATRRRSRCRLNLGLDSDSSTGPLTRLLYGIMPLILGHP